MSAKRKADNMAAASAKKNDSHEPPLVENHPAMMKACASGPLATVLSLLESANANNDIENNNIDSNLTQKHLLAAQQNPQTGLSPLMTASQHGNIQICQALLEAGAPWNAIDIYGRNAGDYATVAEKWDVVNLLVDVGTKAELILGASIRLAKQLEGSNNGKTTTQLKKDDQKQSSNDNHAAKQPQPTSSSTTTTSSTTIPVSHEPCTKPDYLQQTNVRYNAANTLLLDNDNDAVMMEWERPLMNAHANILTHNGTKQKRVLNIGFGLGIIDMALQAYEPSLHVIIEAHPTVYEKMIKDGWNEKEGVRVCFGRWQDELPKLVEEGLEFDGIFYDTYGEHFTDLEDFHDGMAKVLYKPDGIYSFFNGLAPDNLFFHGVACNCVKIQLSHLGLDTEFAQCEIQVNEKDWEGVRRKYWHGRDTYYLPIVTWKKS